MSAALSTPSREARLDRLREEDMSSRERRRRAWEIRRGTAPPFDPTGVVGGAKGETRDGGDDVPDIADSLAEAADEARGGGGAAGDEDTTSDVEGTPESGGEAAITFSPTETKATDIVVERAPITIPSGKKKKKTAFALDRHYSDKIKAAELDEYTLRQNKDPTPKATRIHAPSAEDNQWAFSTFTVGDGITYAVPMHVQRVSKTLERLRFFDVMGVCIITLNIYCSSDPSQSNIVIEVYDVGLKKFTLRECLGSRLELLEKLSLWARDPSGRWTSVAVSLSRRPPKHAIGVHNFAESFFGTRSGYVIYEDAAIVDKYQVTDPTGENVHTMEVNTSSQFDDERMRMMTTGETSYFKPRPHGTLLWPGSNIVSSLYIVETEGKRMPYYPFKGAHREQLKTLFGLFYALRNGLCEKLLKRDNAADAIEDFEEGMKDCDAPDDKSIIKTHVLVDDEERGDVPTRVSNMITETAKETSRPFFVDSLVIESLKGLNLYPPGKHRISELQWLLITRCDIWNRIRHVLTEAATGDLGDPHAKVTSAIVGFDVECILNTRSYGRSKYEATNWMRRFYRDADDVAAVDFYENVWPCFTITAVYTAVYGKKKMANEFVVHPYVPGGESGGETKAPFAHALL